MSEKVTPKEKEQAQEIQRLSSKIDNLEGMISDMAKPYQDTMQMMQKFNEMTSGYLKIINLYQQHGKVSPEMLVPTVKDPIAQDILVILFEKKELNVSQIAEILKDRRGSSSRKTVRDKLKELEEANAIEVVGDKKVKKYKVSDELVDKWLKLLGVMK
ncbi:MAG: helix-turn-helix domain-containing protein [Thermoplasmata archaeon]|nr:helix-turn-helix domain-containing protein [Thermoplasmata archaeon]